MKNTILILSLALISAFGYSQKMGIKLSSEKTFTIGDRILVADSLSIPTITDDGSIISANILFWKKGQRKDVLPYVLWEGADYASKINATHQMVIDRIRVLLNIK